MASTTTAAAIATNGKSFCPVNPNPEGLRPLDFKLERQVSSFKDQEEGFVHVFTSRYDIQSLPKTKMPKKSVPADVVYQAINDLRQLDHNPRLNMASFVTTWMEPEAQKLINESLNVNFVDMEEYPSCADIHNRCVAMLADLLHCPDPENPVGTGCMGSSEAIMLAGLAMKKKWQARRKAAGLPDTKPNLVCGYNVQVCWEKFNRYFDVEERLVPLEEGCYVLTPEKARPFIDENTIGVCGILGSTYNGEFEDIKGLNDMVEELRKEKGWEIPVHVDAASGGFVAPFIYPELEWDFRLPNVRSINLSGHKYGLVYPGLGWLLFRSKEDLPEEMIFHINYLGSDQATVTMNFSKPACFIIAQYYQLLRLGVEGYTKIMRNLTFIAVKLADAIKALGHFEILSKDVGVPLVAFSIKRRRTLADGSEEERSYDEFDLADKLRERGWVLPAYNMAPNARHVKVLRAVIREDHSMTLIAELIKDIARSIEWLDEHYIFTGAQVEALKSRFALHRMDTNILRKKKHDFQC